MRTIHKFPFNVKDEFTLKIPKFSVVRHVEVQGEQGPCLWAEVDTEKEKIEYRFRIFGTGYEIPEDLQRKGLLEFVATFQQPPFVWHLYQEYDNA